ncbi:MAG: (2Fe-2S)-binding protein [Ideonella sp.]|nr:(2Fe-2S)-binding protein [Ideonella sp.]
MNAPAKTQRISVQVNGATITRDVEPRRHLIDFLREDCGLKGSHLGCEHGVCGACTVRVIGQSGGATIGQIVRGCLVLAVQVDGKAVQTVETPTPSPQLRALQDAFLARNALQCGYCTPGMLMAAQELLAHRPDADREAVREWMSGNYCRCTGYHAIVDAVCDVLQLQREGKLTPEEAA